MFLLFDWLTDEVQMRLLYKLKIKNQIYKKFKLFKHNLNLAEKLNDNTVLTMIFSLTQQLVAQNFLHWLWENCLRFVFYLLFAVCIKLDIRNCSFIQLGKCEFPKNFGFKNWCCIHRLWSFDDEAVAEFVPSMHQKIEE